MLTATHRGTQPDASAPSGDTRRPGPSADLIRVRAYEISRARNGGPGNAASDWSQAEAELRLDWSTTA